MIVLLAVLSSLLNCNTRQFTETQRQHLVSDSGFIPDGKAMWEASQPELSIYDFNAHEVIADIGFGTGWLEGISILRYDSLTIYAEDIDQYNIRALPVRMSEYEALRPSPNTNTLWIVKGRKTKTTLPQNTFDKVIVRETFHHFSQPDLMLRDIHGILKSDGLLFVYEPLVDETIYDKEDGAMNYSRDDILVFFDRNAFRLVSEHDLFGNPGNVPPWWSVPESHIVAKKIFVFIKT